MKNPSNNKLKNILFVCTGNTCRSPMAEGILNNAIENDVVLLGNFKAFSAGLRVNAGERVSPNAALVLKNEWGIDISGHKAEIVYARDIKDTFLILTMEKSHKNALANIFPEMRGKIFTFKEYAGEDTNIDISDPFMGNYDTYKRCANEIYINVYKLIDKLKRLVQPTL